MSAQVAFQKTKMMVSWEKLGAVDVTAADTLHMPPSTAAPFWKMRIRRQLN